MSRGGGLSFLCATRLVGERTELAARWHEPYLWELVTHLRGEAVATEVVAVPASELGALRAGMPVPDSEVRRFGRAMHSGSLTKR